MCNNRQKKKKDALLGKNAKQVFPLYVILNINNARLHLHTLIVNALSGLGKTTIYKICHPLSSWGKI